MAVKAKTMSKATVKKQATRNHYLKCLDFLQRMSWHLSFTPDVNKFSVMAYRAAHEALTSHGTLDGIETLKGIGKTMLDHFDNITHNRIPRALKDIERNGPPFEVRELTRIAGVGEKTAAKLFTEHKVTSLTSLGAAIKAHRVTDPKLISAYLDMGAVDERIPRYVIEANVEPILESIRAITGKDTRIEHVGSFRRHRSDIRDIDILIGTDDKSAIKAVTATLKQFADHVRLVDKEGSKKCEVQINMHGKQRKLDVYFVQPRCWGSALMHFTGPERYNIAVRVHAKKSKLKVSQYGVTDLRTKKIKRFSTEQAMCEYLGIPYLEPELRDNFPLLKDVKSLSKEQLITTKMVKCDLHVHCTASDGKSPFSDVFRFYKQGTHSAVCISNHSKGTGNGLDVAGVLKHHETLRAKYQHKEFTRGVDKQKQKCLSRLLCGAEVDIKADGSLDYDDETLKTFDYVIISIHHGFDKKPTERLLAAIEHMAKLEIPTVIAHPTGRIIGYRPEALIDWSKVLPKCAEHGVALEINGQGDRVDATDALIQKAKHAGCMFVVSSDFHGTTHEEKTKLLERAVMQARRGWLTRDQVVNCSTRQMAAWLGHDRYKRVWLKDGKV